MTNDLHEERKKVNFKDTLNLPRTDFPIRVQAAIEEPAMLERWGKNDLYHATFLSNKGKKTFILHDGPPYANGHIHLGTAYNKILKDIIAKSKRMAGYHTPVTPGWDCHGLPIELNVTKQYPEVSGTELKKKCRAYAQHWIAEQKKEFKNLGVLMDWQRPYLTMDYKYEARTIRAFGDMVSKGYIEYKQKTVPWCASCKTVLASAEIEYFDRKDPSIYMTFALTSDDIKKRFPSLASKSVSFLIWTTTPWTVPLNRAVILKKDLTYVVLEAKGRYIIVGEPLADVVCEKMGVEKRILFSCKAEDLQGTKAHHPLIGDLLVPVLLEQFVTTHEGTAVVHSAPGCGPEDYEIGIKHGLEIYSPIASDGTYTQAILSKELKGVFVSDAHRWVIKNLQDNNALMHKESIKHSYPHCWRCRKGLIFRATKQWFCNLAHKDLRTKAVEHLQTTNFLPDRTRRHLQSAIESRLEWCLSRQRKWGTPIPAFICIHCKTPIINKELIDKVADGVEKEGVEFWDSIDINTLISKGTLCSVCGKNNFTKEQDILDVWFDAGVSHYAVLKFNPELAFPADMYCEGIDQHRGWFQSSFLTSLSIEGTPAMKKIVSHGYTVDKDGRKMSKSLGNVIAPQEMINELGRDGLRLWVSSTDVGQDPKASKVLIDNVKEAHRKIRNTARFLLSNLYDYNHIEDVVSIENMLSIDQYALQCLFNFNKKMRTYYDLSNVTGVYHALVDFCTIELSSFYLDIIKDRLYTDKVNGHQRRSAQTACFYILDTLVRLIAPIMSFAAEDLSDYYQKNKVKSIHLQEFSEVKNIWDMLAQREFSGHTKGQQLDIKREQQWQAWRSIRLAVLKAIEQVRERGIVKHSLEARVVLAMNIKNDTMKNAQTLLYNMAEQGESPSSFLKEFFIASEVDIIDWDDIADEEGEENEFCKTIDDTLFIQVSHARGTKCPRCWQWEVVDHNQGLCKRCSQVVQAMKV